jgi:hypothetical protein
MSIPIQNTPPTYPLTIPSSKKKIRYRPFLEIEKKALLMALESKDSHDILEAIKRVITNCCENIDLDKLALFDIEYIFLHLRAKSIGEIVKLNYRCNNIVDDKPCGRVMHPEIDITTAIVEGLKDDTKIKLTPKIGVKMKYPTLDLLENLTNVSQIDYVYELIMASIDFIWDGDNIYYAKDYPHEDLMDFLMSLLHDQFKKLEEFVSEIPTVKKTFDVKCTKCGFDHQLTIEGYQRFFI